MILPSLCIFIYLYCRGPKQERVVDTIPMLAASSEYNKMHRQTWHVGRESVMSTYIRIE